MAKFMINKNIYLLSIFIFISSCGARRDLTKLSVLNIDFDYLTKFEVNNAKQQRAFFIDSASVVIPENYNDTSWNNYVGTSIKLNKSGNSVLFIDAFIMPTSLLGERTIDWEYGYKFLFEIPGKLFPCTINFGFGSQNKAFAHYFHYGGPIKCWYFKGIGSLKIIKCLKDSIQTDLNVTFLPDSTCEGFVSHQINIAGKSTIPIIQNLELFKERKQ